MVETKKAALLRYLRTLGSSDATEGKLISGHFCGVTFAPEAKATSPFTLAEVRQFHARAGKWVGLLGCWLQGGRAAGADLESISSQMWFDDLKAGLEEHCGAGGLVMAGAAFSCPLASHYADRYCGRHETYEIPSAETITAEGTRENARWMMMLNKIGDFFAWCDERDIPVIWRPFTELYLSQFWYGKIDHADFRRLWTHMHRYFTETRKIRGLLWEFNGKNRLDPKYPGDEFVDMFASPSSYTSGHVEEDDTGSRPWCQGELGDQKDYNAWIEEAKRKAPYMAYFMTWEHGFGPVGHEYDGSSREFNPTYDQALLNPWVLNRDDLEKRRQESFQKDS